MFASQAVQGLHASASACQNCHAKAHVIARDSALLPLGVDVCLFPVLMLVGAFSGSCAGHQQHLAVLVGMIG